MGVSESSRLASRAKFWTSDARGTRETVEIKGLAKTTCRRPDDTTLQSPRAS